MNNLSIALYYIAIVVVASVFFKKEAYDTNGLPLEESKIINPMDAHLSALPVSQESRETYKH